MRAGELMRREMEAVAEKRRMKLKRNKSYVMQTV